MGLDEFMVSFMKPEDFVNQILCEDTLKFMRRIPDKFIDIIVTDPPYGMDYRAQTKRIKDRKIVNDKDTPQWRRLIRAYIKECSRILKDGGAIYCFCSWHKVEFFKNVIDKRFNTKGLLVWEKNNHGGGDLAGAYAPIHELILFATKSDRHILRGNRSRDVLEFAKVSSLKYDHPTTKPDDLMAFLIMKSSEPNDIVFDGFMGSGATARAAVLTGRCYTGAEIKKKDVITALNSLESLRDTEIGPHYDAYDRWFYRNLPCEPWDGHETWTAPIPDLDEELANMLPECLSHLKPKFDNKYEEKESPPKPSKARKTPKA